MKAYGEIPAGKSELKPLIYPFHTRYPLKLWSKYRWRTNSRLRDHLPSINRRNRWITVIDRLGAPGDALITANIIRCIKNEYPKIKVNCITPNPELIQFDPSIDSINQRETFFSFDSTYWELIVRKEKKQNIVVHNLKRLRINQCDYKSKFYLSKKEKKWAKSELNDLTKPLIAINTRSKEAVKNWPIHYWIKFINSISQKFCIIQIGDDKEPELENVIRFAGKHTMRESASLLSQTDFFIGPDSLLMHVANGLEIKSIIIFGGSRPIDCFGYEGNINLHTTPSCSPCWIHDGYEKCSFDVECMNNINVEKVLNALNSLLYSPKNTV